MRHTSDKMIGYLRSIGIPLRRASGGSATKRTGLETPDRRSEDILDIAIVAIEREAATPTVRDAVNPASPVIDGEAAARAIAETINESCIRQMATAEDGNKTGVIRAHDRGGNQDPNKVDASPVTIDITRMNEKTLFALVDLVQAETDVSVLRKLIRQLICSHQRLLTVNVKNVVNILLKRGPVSEIIQEARSGLGILLEKLDMVLRDDDLLSKFFVLVRMENDTVVLGKVISGLVRLTAIATESKDVLAARLEESEDERLAMLGTNIEVTKQNSDCLTRFNHSIDTIQGQKKLIDKIRSNLDDSLAENDFLNTKVIAFEEEASRKAAVKTATQLLRREAEQAEKLRTDNAALQKNLFELQSVQTDNDRLKADVQVIQKLKVENAKLKGKCAAKNEAGADPGITGELGSKSRVRKKQSGKPIVTLTRQENERPSVVIESAKNGVASHVREPEGDSLQSLRKITAAALVTLPNHEVEAASDWKTSGKFDTTSAKIMELNKKSIDERYPLKNGATAEEFEEQAVQMTRRIKARCRGSLADVGKLRGSPAEGLQVQVQMEAILRRLIEGVVEDIEGVLAIKGLH